MEIYDRERDRDKGEVKETFLEVTPLKFWIL